MVGISQGEHEAGYDNRRADAPFRPTIGVPPPGIDPRVLRLTLASDALGIRKTVYVYVPPAHASSDDRYPVLYLLRGHEREWLNPHEDSTRRGTVIDVYLRLLQAGEVGPMILVFPGLTSDDGHIHGMATDLRARALAPDRPGLGTGRFETYLVHEVLPSVDRLFRTRTDRRRGVDGFSLGGFMALKLAARYPMLISSAGAYDGTFLYADPSGEALSADDRLFMARPFNPAFGVPRDHAHAAANNPANLIAHSSATWLRYVRWMVQYGPEHLEPWGSNYYRGAYLQGLLEARGVDNDVTAVIPDGAHDWATADRHMQHTLPLHWRTLTGG